MTREEAIVRIKGLYGNGYAEQEQALDMAISDMNKIEKFEAENQRLKATIVELNNRIELGQRTTWISAINKIEGE